MKRVIFLIIVALSCNAIYCQLTYDWKWATGAGSSSNDSGKAIATDSSGNVFVTGMYTRTITFGSTTLTDDGAFPYESNIFVAKMDSLGNWLWAKKVICGNIWVETLSLDVAGNCIIAGQFNGAASFGTQIVSHGGVDGFIAKLDTNGNWLWAKAFGGAGDEAALSVSSDSAGGIYVTGNFSETVIVNTTLLISSGSKDIFVLKMDSNGNWIWAKRAGGTEGDLGYGINTDNSGNSFVTGSFRLSASFGSASINSYGYDDIFVAKIDTNGNWLWANSAGSANGDEGTSVTHDSLGNVYLTGRVASVATFGLSTLETFGSAAAFVAKLDVSGSWEWTLNAGSNAAFEGKSIDINDYGNIFVAGDFSGTLHYGSSSITANGARDVFAAMIDCDSNWLFLKQAGGVDNEDVFGLAIDRYSGVVVTGRFSTSASFGANNLISNGNDDIFVARLTQKSPTADFTSSITEGYEQLSVQFTDSSISGWGENNNWYWDFGDGNTSNVQNPLHIYENDGLYSVSLKVTNTYALSDTLLLQDYIHVLPRNPGIALNPVSALDFGVTNLGSQPIKDLWIRNIGHQTLTVESLSFMLPDSSFEILGLTIPFEVLEGDSTFVQIRFTPLVTGSVIDSLFIMNNSINLPRAAIRLCGTGQFIPPMQPQNVSLMMEGSNAVISWDAVTESEMHTPMVPDYYLVFSCPSGPQGIFGFLGATPGLQFTHYLVGLHSSHMFYRVRAYMYIGRGGVDFGCLGLVDGMSEDEVLSRLTQ